jgi:hypothetical protein
MKILGILDTKIVHKVLLTRAFNNKFSASV